MTNERRSLLKNGALLSFEYTLFPFANTAERNSDAKERHASYGSDGRRERPAKSLVCAECLEAAERGFLFFLLGLDVFVS